jgi:MFS family permease
MGPAPVDRFLPAAPEPLWSGRFARITTANFFFFLTFASFFLLPLHVRALGGSERTVGFVMGTSGISGIVSIFAVGILLDRFGRRRFLRAGFIGMALASAGFLFVHSIGPAFFALRVLQGISFAAGFNASSTLAVECAPASRRTEALGLFGVSTLTTHAIAPSFGELIVRTGGFPVLFAVASSFSLLGVAIAWSLPEAPVSVPRGAGRRLQPSRTLVTSIVTVTLCGVAFGTVLTYVPTFVHDAGLGAVSTFFLSYTLTAILSRLVGGGLGDTRGHGTVIVPALAVFSCSIVGLAAVRSPLGLAAAGLVFGAAQGLVYPTLNAFTVDHVQPDQFGRAQSLYNGCFNLGVTGGSLGLGHVAEVAGHRVVFLCAAAAAATALVVFSVGTRGRASVAAARTRRSEAARR